MQAGGAAATTRSRHARHSSHTHSLSSSSGVTVKRSASLSSSSTGPRSSTAHIPSQRPGRDHPHHYHRHAPPDPPDPHSSRDHHHYSHHMSVDPGRRKNRAVEPAGPGGRSESEGEGLTTVNRWSHSTDSSTASRDSARRRRPSAPGSPSGPSPKRSKNPRWDHSPHAPPRRKPVAATAAHPGSSSWFAAPDHGAPVSGPPPKRPAPDLLTALPPLQPTPALTDSNDTESPSTTAPTATTPLSSHSPYAHSDAQDYFGAKGRASRKSPAKDKKPAMLRNHSAPIAQFAHWRPADADRRPHESRARSRPKAPRTTERGSWSEITGANPDGPYPRLRTREGLEQDKKAMLSKALQKAHTAVLLDNVQNFEGALEAYTEACRLLLQVMDRSAGADDKRKLEAIRVTYANRIEELRQLDVAKPPSPDDVKSLPARPPSADSQPLSPASIASTPSIAAAARSPGIVETATMARMASVPRLSYLKKDPARGASRVPEPGGGRGRGSSPRRPERRRERTPPEDTGSETEDGETRAGAEHDSDTATAGAAAASHPFRLAPPEENKYMPAPLSPRKLPSPTRVPGTEERAESNDPSASWLDTIDESGSERAASVHALSQDGPQPKNLRHSSGESDPDFDTAFDAAVEAAYDQGLEPDLEARRKRATAFKHAPQPSATVPSSDVREILSPTAEVHHPAAALGAECEDDVEERLLDEITQDYAQGFNFDLSSKSALPRQSDSSGYSRSTWQSSQASVDRATAGTSLSTVAEDTLTARFSKQKPAGMYASMAAAAVVRPDQGAASAPPMTALPSLPALPNSRVSGVRGRRMSGHANPRQLKIETASKPELRKRASTFHHSPSPRLADDEPTAPLDGDAKIGAALEPTPSDVQHEIILKSPPSLDLLAAASQTASGPASAGPASAGPAKRRSLDDAPTELLPAKPHFFRKNKSSLSLQDHAMSASSPDDAAASSLLATPLTSTLMPFQSKRSQDPLTSHRTKFPSFDAGHSVPLPPVGGGSLFDTSLTSDPPPQASPQSPSSSAQPVELEPCPESFLLRPFWLMRAIASTLTHPKGGFVTTRLFVPREVWQTRGVKIKAIEDKMANCDLLTAALGRLAGVDTYDADAMMGELQSFEEVMERVQGALSKKLGNEVGLHGVAGSFRDASGMHPSGTATSHGPDATAAPEKATKSKEGKSYLHSWRKLRNKSAGTPLSGSQPTTPAAAAEKELPQMPSVPMTSFVAVERRGHKKDARSWAFEGPQKEYMGSLARLFEGAQVLDQIARQVEDPGLKHSSPTYVGLELSIRHAAEFFGFYVCRFVLADLGLLLDKFLKRGTEWVLA